MSDPSVIAAALAAVASVAAARELMAAWPSAQAWVGDALAPLIRSGTEGYEPSDRERRRLWILGSVATGVVMLGLVGWGFYLVVVGLVPVASDRLISLRRRRYARTVEAGIGSWARSTADAIAAGRSVRSALMAPATAPRPEISAELARVRADLEAGSSVETALSGLRARVGSPGMTSIAGALELTARRGGDAAALLRRFADAHDDRVALAADSRSATAQARMTGLVVAALPAAGLLFAELASPGFAAALAGDPVARTLLVVSFAMQAAGFVVIRRISEVVA